MEPLLRNEEAGSYRRNNVKVIKIQLLRGDQRQIGKEDIFMGVNMEKAEIIVLSEVEEINNNNY